MASRLRSVTSRIPALALLVTVPAFSATAGATAYSATEPGSVTSVPEPEPSPQADATSPSPNADSQPEPDADAPLDDEGAVPEPATEPATEPTEPAPTDVAAPSATTEEPRPDGIDPMLLEAPEPEPIAPVATAPVATGRAGSSPEEEAAAIEDAYAARYRPADNPARINVAGRLMFANISGQDRVNGRMGGAAVDIGPSWNRIGISGTVSGWAGRVLLPPESGAELNGMLGGGLTLGLGRLALLSHGFLDLRLGYDVFYGVVNQRADSPTILAPQADDPRFVAELTESLVPHGPRVRLDLGLVGAGNRRYFHGFGLSMGYQALVGSFKGDLPMTSMLTIGLSYWMG